MMGMEVKQGVEKAVISVTSWRKQVEEGFLKAENVADESMWRLHVVYPRLHLTMIYFRKSTLCD